jgi:hypothetical protein
MLLLQTDWNSSVFSICHRTLVLLQLEQFRVVAAPALVAVPLIFIKVETPAVGKVQYFDQSQAFSAASVAAPDNVKAPAVSAVKTVMYGRSLVLLLLQPRLQCLLQLQQYRY